MEIGDHSKGKAAVVTLTKNLRPVEGGFVFSSQGTVAEGTKKKQKRHM